MQCPSCHHTNEADDRFCSACGLSLTVECPSCGVELKPGAKFCSKCGANVAPPDGATTPPDISAQASATTAPTRAGFEGDRRQLTVLFCDIVDATALSSRLDPEELREIIHAYQASARTVVEQFEGWIAQYLGDGLLVYFGYPRAHEDDAQRAVHAALGIVDAIRELNLSQSSRFGQALEIRIGIHSGVVVVGNGEAMPDREALAIGETPNIAARLQSHAAPDTILISEASEKLLGGRFECTSVGELELKGIPAPLVAAQVVGINASASRFDAATLPGLTPLVGRAQEVGLLADRWQLAREGEGQVILIGGEPGIGKSRLLRELRESVGNELLTVLRFQCSPYHIHSAYYPLTDHLEQTLGLREAGDAVDKLERLERLVLTELQMAGEHVPLLADLMGIPTADRYPASTTTPQRRKDDTVSAAVDLALAVAAGESTLILFEDAHWADPTTLEFLELLITRLSTARLMLVVTHRPEFASSWTAHGHVSALTLSRLGRTQCATIVSRLASGRNLAPNLLDEIVAKTDGVPLFVEELTRSILESGDLTEQGQHLDFTSDERRLAIPATLRDSLMARLDRNPGVKEIAQLGAVIGREFSYGLLAEIADLDTNVLDENLTQLVASGLAFRRGAGSDALYIFKHALVQDAAYESLLKNQRQQRHGRVALGLERNAAAGAPVQPELLAHHLTEAGETAAAIVHWQQAGKLALERSANVEAAAHLRRGLVLCRELPSSSATLEQELSLLVSLGPALMATQGYATPEVAETYERARELCETVEFSAEQFPMLFGLWLYFGNVPDWSGAGEIVQKLLAAAERGGESEHTLISKLAHGVTLGWVGNFSESAQHLEDCIAMYSPARHHRLTFQYGGLDPGTFSHAHVGMAWWYHGYPERALTRTHEGVELAKQIAHPISLAHTLLQSSWVHILCGDMENARSLAMKAKVIAEENQGDYWIAFANIVIGTAAHDVLAARSAIDALASTGAKLARPLHLGWLTELYMQGGQVTKASAALDEALRHVAGGEAMVHAELYRLRGELILTAGDGEDASVAAFERAIEIAREQDARSLELRALISLTRMQQGSSNFDFSRDRLAAVYTSFTEGFETKDLRDAKTLLA